MNSEFELVTWDTVTAVVPVLVATTLKELSLFRITLPKLAVVGLTVSNRLMPVPDSETVAGELEALLVKDTEPLTLPVAEGANAAVKLALWREPNVRGREGPETLKPVPETLSWVT